MTETARPVIRRRSSESAVRRVAVLVDTATNWGRQILTGIHRYVQRHEGWQLFFQPRGPEEAFHLPSGWQGDGVIARIKSPEMAAHLEESRLPVVNVSAIHLPRQPFPVVTSDMEQLARCAAEYFLDRGYRHFAYMSLMGLEYVVRQQKAFASAVKEAGCQCVVRRIPTHCGSQVPAWDLDLEPLAVWLASLPKPLAVLTWSGGREITLACQLACLRVPEDVSLLTAVDDFHCQMADPSISAIEPACEDIGYQAARVLSAIMKGRKPPREPLLFPVRRVVTRQSTDTFAMADPAVLAALQYIHEHAASNIHVADIALRAGVSRRVLERRFMELLKRSPGEELRRCRLDKASRLLEQTALPIAEVAERCGFGSPEYMTAVFHKERKLSPLRYRRESHSMAGGFL